MTVTLAPPTPDPIAAPPGPRRPGTVVAFAVVAAAAVITLGVVAVFAVRSSDGTGRVTTMMGGSNAGSYNMPYGTAGPMMGGGSMMGGNYGATSRAVAGARDIAVTAKAPTFTPNQIHVKAGETVNISLTAADRPNDFTIDALGVQVAAAAGQTVRGALRAPATPGQYIFYCSVPGDRQAGMTGTLVVAPQADPRSDESFGG